MGWLLGEILGVWPAREVVTEECKLGRQQEFFIVKEVDGFISKVHVEKKTA